MFDKFRKIFSEGNNFIRQYDKKFRIIILSILAAFLFSAETYFGKIKTGISESVSKGVRYSVYVPENFNRNKTYPLIVQRPFLWELGYDSERILNLVPALISRYNIDRKQILLTGQNSIATLIIPSLTS